MNQHIAIDALIEFALARSLIKYGDTLYARNQLYDALGETPPVAPPSPREGELPGAPTPYLEALCEHAAQKGLIGDTPAARELFDTRLMGLLTPRPSAVASRFQTIENAQGSAEALEWFYQLNVDTNYIRKSSLSRNIAYEAALPAGPGTAPKELEITINLAKPEKDPRDIEAERTAPQSDYPRCMLCAENEGYPGRAGYPARQTLRLIPLALQGEEWFLQYSPYQYYDHHCIALCGEHRPMGISEHIFARLLDFVARFPSYFMGSNAGLPIAGGSILSHDHYQGGKHVFPMDRADEASKTEWRSVSVSALAWPLPCLRLTGALGAVRDAARSLQDAWLTWSDESLGIMCRSDAQHNAVTPIARALGDGVYRMDVVLRNNRTDGQYPMGIFHPHEDKHHIKKENIGLIEVMGCMILPGRLRDELEDAARALSGVTVLDAAAFEKHAPWVTKLAARYGAEVSLDAAREIIRRETATVCAGVLSDAGVYKQTPEGRAGFGRFMASAGINL